MTRSFVVQHGVDMTVQDVGADAASLGKPIHGLGQRDFLRGAVDFSSVASREDRGLGLLAHAVAQAVQHRSHLIDGKGESPSQIERSGGVVET
jgi:hypothetical protein